ncbi:MAG: DUF4493 domain-containing protein [Bacteroidales bacterium]|nr:DUF4493 domain-containing protein [Bacteroidales bacterium]
MRTTLQLLAILAALLLIPVSCQDLFRQNLTGTLVVTLPELFPPSTRAANGLPDTGEFLVCVTNAEGKVVYENTYAQFPDELPVPAGTYTVSAVSAVFAAPAFDAPQWGDTQIVAVPQGGSAAVALNCTQLNSGLRLTVEDSFRSAFPAGKLSLKGAEGSLPYAYDEQRTAFFHPGAVSLVLDDEDYVQTLFTRTLAARQMLSIRLGASVGARSGGVSLQVDTVRTWQSEDFTVGGAGPETPDGAYDVLQAREHAGETGVWVQGYIVGVATNTKKVDFEGPFTKNTNLVLGTHASTTDLGYCLSVELKAGPVREALNLQDHPGLLGKKVYIKGDLVDAYYGIPGLKSPSEYGFY